MQAGSGGGSSGGFTAGAMKTTGATSADGGGMYTYDTGDIMPHCIYGRHDTANRSTYMPLYRVDKAL